MKKRKIIPLAVLGVILGTGLSGGGLIYAANTIISPQDAEITVIEPELQEPDMVQRTETFQQNAETLSADSMQAYVYSSEAGGRTEEVVQLDVADGPVYIKNEGYQVGTDAANFVSYKGKYILTGTYIEDRMAQFVNTRVYITGGSETNPISITLKELKIDNAVHGFGGSSRTDVPCIKIGQTTPWVTGHARITLEGDNELLSDDNSAGIGINSTTDYQSTLVLEGAGSLHAKSNGAGAGIGASSQVSDFYNPKITINSGTIVAEGGKNAAGIGGGQGVNGGDITINGGTVNAVGGSKGAGIGAGIQFSDAINPGEMNITIFGGTVNASGGEFASAIGIGMYQYPKSGSEIISGIMNINIGGAADVTATGGKTAPAIGSGYTSTTRSAGELGWKIQQINITGGTIVARADNGNMASAIGSGICSEVDEINISDGTVHAIGGDYAAAIGTSYVTSDWQTNSQVDTINISGGTIRADGARWGAGIGTGYTAGNTLTSRVNEITISGGDITAASLYAGAGIGTGHQGVKTDVVNIDKISITGGTVNAGNVEFGAGIGTGGTALLNVIEIRDGDVVATGGYQGAGIGSGHMGTVKDIRLLGGHIKASASYIVTENGFNGNAAGVGSGLDGRVESITISGDTVLDVEAGAFAAAIGRGYHREGVDNPVTAITIEGTPQITAYAVGSPNGSEYEDDHQEYMQAIDYEGLTGCSETLLMGHFKNTFVDGYAEAYVGIYVDVDVKDKKGEQYALQIPAIFQSFAVTTKNAGIHTVSVDGELYAGNDVKNEDRLTIKLDVKDNQLSPYWFLQPIGNVVVAFESNGGTEISSITTGKGETIDKPNEPVKENHIFKGWYTDREFTNEWKFESDKVVQDMTLYAKWNINTYTIAYQFTSDRNPDGISVPQTSIIEYKGTVEEPVFTVPANWTFSGWYADRQYTNRFNFDTTITADLTLYGKWSYENGRPVSPIQPDKPGDGTNNDNITDQLEPSVKTGDTSRAVWYITGLAIALLTCSIVYIKRRKKGNIHK